MHRKPTGPGRRFAAAFALILAASAAWIALGGAELHGGIVLADGEGRGEEIRKRLDGFEKDAAEIMALFGDFARPVIGGSEPDGRKRDRLLTVLAEHRLEVGHLSFLVGDEVVPLFDEYRSSLVEFREAVRRTAGFHDLKPAYEALARVEGLRRDIVAHFGAASS